MDPISKSLNEGEQWTFLDGSRRSVVTLRSAFVGCGHYAPGWKWSEHVGPQTGKMSQSHIGYVLSGRLCVRSKDGVETLVGPGEAFEVSSNHDAWVVGDEPCIALDFGCLSGFERSAL